MLNKIDIIIATLLACACVFAFLQMREVDEVSEQLKKCQIQIDIINADSIATLERYQSAEQQAKQDLEKSQARTNEILLASVPADCNAAMQWGVQQAHDFI